MVPRCVFPWRDRRPPVFRRDCYLAPVQTTAVSQESCAHLAQSVDLVQDCHGPELLAFDPQRLIEVGGEHHNRKLPSPVADMFQYFDPAAVEYRNVEDHGFRSRGLDPGEGFAHRACLPYDLETLCRSQVLYQCLTGLGYILDNVNLHAIRPGAGLADRLNPSRLLKNAVQFGYKLRGVRKERARQTGRVLDRDPSAAQIERRPILPAGERSSGHNWFWGRSAPAVPASL